MPSVDSRWAACTLAVALHQVAAAQCGVLLQEALTIPEDVGSYRSHLLHDPDGPGPLPDLLLIGADKGRVFAFDGERFRQFGPRMVDPGVTYTHPTDPHVFHLLHFRGELHAVAAGYVSSTNGSVFRWNGSTWIAAPRASACGAGTLSGWFLGATVHENEIVVAGSNLRCGNQNATALAWNGSTWRRLGDAPFSAPSVVGAIHSTRDGRLFIGGAFSRASPAESVVIAELLDGAWQTRLRGTSATSFIAAASFVEADDDLFLCGSVSLSASEPPRVVLRESSPNWVVGDPFNAAAAPPAMEVANDLFFDGPRTFIAGGLLSGRGALVLFDPAPTVVDLPYNGAKRITGGVVRYGGLYFGLGGTPAASSVCAAAPGLLLADTASPTNWRTIPPLLATTSSRPALGTIVAGHGRIFAGRGATQTEPAVLRTGQCSPDASASLDRVDDRWVPPADRLNGSVLDMTLYRNQPVAVGGFTQAGARPVTRGIVKWDGSAWQSFDAPLPVSGLTIQQTAAIGPQLFVVASGPSGLQVFRFMNDAWTTLGPVTPSSGPPLIAATDTRLVIATGNRILEWSGSNWNRLGTDTDSPSVSALEFFQGEPVVGSSGSSPVRRWSGSQWIALGTFTPDTASIRSLRVHAGELFAGLLGPVTSPRAPLMRLAGQSWVPAISNPPLLSTDPASLQSILDLWSDGDTLHLAGEFLQLAGFSFEGYATLYSGPPRFHVKPVPSRTRSGDTAYFSIDPEVHHDPAQTYAWRRNGQPLANGPTPSGSVIEGASSPFLRILNVSTADAGTYDLILSNACGQSTSAQAPLLIRCPADLDDGSNTATPDGAVTIDDLLFFLEAFTQGAPAADLDNGTNTGTPDGTISIEDLLYFLVSYEAGC